MMSTGEQDPGRQERNRRHHLEVGAGPRRWFRKTKIKERDMLKKLFQTPDDTVFTLLRLVLGVVFFLHGSQKMLGWFGGYGFKGTMGFFTQTAHIPPEYGLLYPDGTYSGGLRLSGNCRGVFRRTGTDSRPADPHRRLWDHCQYARGDLRGAHAQWLLHELDRPAEG